MSWRAVRSVGVVLTSSAVIGSAAGHASPLLVSIGGANAAYPGGNGLIAFSSDRVGNYEIYTVRPDGSDLTRLTFDPGPDLAPSWSPDGVDVGGGDPDDPSSDSFISADGRYVGFDSAASDLVQGNGNGMSDVFVRDLMAETTVRATVDTDGGDPDGHSYLPSLSADGRYVALFSYASDLVAGDENGFVDVFIRDLVAGTTIRASLNTGGGDPNGESSYPSISADGRYVAFESFASDLVPGDARRGWPDVFSARWRRV